MNQIAFVLLQSICYFMLADVTYQPSQTDSGFINVIMSKVISRKYVSNREINEVNKYSI